MVSSVPYARIKIAFDVICLIVTGALTFGFLGHLDGLGIGTVLAAFTMGKMVALCGDLLDRRFHFETAPALSRLRGADADNA